MQLSMNAVALLLGRLGLWPDLVEFIPTFLEIVTELIVSSLADVVYLMSPLASSLARLARSFLDRVSPESFRTEAQFGRAAKSGTMMKLSTLLLGSWCN